MVDNTFDRLSQGDDQTMSNNNSPYKTSREFNSNPPIRVLTGNDPRNKMTTTAKESFLGANRGSQKSMKRGAGGAPMDVFIPKQLRINNNKAKQKTDDDKELIHAVKNYMKNTDKDQKQSP